MDEDDESSFPVLSPKASPTRNHPLDWTRHYVLALVSWFAPQNLDHPATSSHSSLEWRVDHVFGQWHDSSLSSPLCHCFSRPESSGRTMESCWVAKYRLGLARTLYLRCAARDHYHCGRSIVLHNSNLCLLEPPDFCFFWFWGLYGSLTKTNWMPIKDMAIYYYKRNPVSRTDAITVYVKQSTNDSKKGNLFFQSKWLGDLLVLANRRSQTCRPTALFSLNQCWNPPSSSR